MHDHTARLRTDVQRQWQRWEFRRQSLESDSGHELVVCWSVESLCSGKDTGAKEAGQAALGYCWKVFQLFSGYKVFCCIRRHVCILKNGALPSSFMPSTLKVVTKWLQQAWQWEKSEQSQLAREEMTQVTGILRSKRVGSCSQPQLHSSTEGLSRLSSADWSTGLNFEGISELTNTFISHKPISGNEIYFVMYELLKQTRGIVAFGGRDYLYNL